MPSLENVIAKLKEKSLTTKGANAAASQWFRRGDVLLHKQQNAGSTQSKKEAEEKERLKRLTEFLDAKPSALKSALGSDEATLHSNKRQRKESSGVSELATDSQVDHQSAEKKNAASSSKKELPPPSEIITRLRQLGQVATFFGESDEKRYLRYCEAAVAAQDDELAGGQQNIFVKLLAGKKDVTDATVVKPGQETLPDENSASRENRVMSWITEMLLAWEEELAQRDETTKNANEGRIQTAQLLQTKRDLKPLFKRLRERTLDDIILEKLAAIIDACRNAEYKLAHDKYIELSIGNAAWPIGVTMVGIHERAGRSRIATSEIAHILNDEITRKYIHMLKRLISFCQRTRPTDPSKMVSISSTHI